MVEKNQNPAVKQSCSVYGYLILDEFLFIISHVLSLRIFLILDKSDSIYEFSMNVITCYLTSNR